MSGTVISTYSTAGLTLSSAIQNPVTITQSGEINASSSTAIDGVSLATPWTIENSGTLKDTYFYHFLGSNIPDGVAISLTDGGTVTNEQSDYIYGNGNGVAIGGVGSVTNFGAIHGEGKYGVIISGTGHVVNGSAADTSAYIGGKLGGFWGFSSGYLDNYGTVSASAEVAVNLGDGLNDTIINGSAIDKTAVIEGKFGGVIIDTGTLINFGTLLTGPDIGSNYGVFLSGTGLIVNNGVIEGGSGVLIGANGTLINAGTIIGSNGSGAAVYFQTTFAGQSSKLIVDPGAEFLGTVKGRAMVTMELASAASSGTISGLGTQFTDIKTISIDSGASWTISGDVAGLANGQSITGFSVSDILVLDGFTATSSIVSGTTLILSDGVVSETLHISTDLTSPAFLITDVADGTEISICYLKGTRILTAAGEVVVEDLRIGDEVATRYGGMRRIKWIGRQSFSGRFVRNNPAQIPICISAGALGDGLPRRNLWVSPGHSMLLGETLVLARDLVNGITIRQENPPEELYYFQLDFGTHDCVLAEGAWSEAYADAPGLRAAFHNFAEYKSLYPNEPESTNLRLCAPRPEAGPALDAALRPIAARAAAMVPPGKLQGWVEEVTETGFVRGWAMDHEAPNLPVLLEVVCYGEIVQTMLACEYRGDLAASGLGQGRCGFAVFLTGKSIWPVADIFVRRATSAELLPFTHEFLATHAA